MLGDLGKAHDAPTQPTGDGTAVGSAVAFTGFVIAGWTGRACPFRPSTRFRFALGQLLGNGHGRTRYPQYRNDRRVAFEPADNDVVVVVVANFVATKV